MKINIFSTPGDGRCGIGTYTRYLSDEQLKIGNDLNFFYININENQPAKFIKISDLVTRNCDIVHIQFDYSLFGKFIGMTGVWVILFYPVLCIFSRVRKCKIVTTMHEVWDFHSPPRFGVIGSIYAFILNFLVMKCSDIIIALSENAHRTILQQGIPIKKLYMIPHGLKIPAFLDKTYSRTKLGFNKDSSIILQFGFISETKGQDILVEASTILPQEYTIVIAGSCKTSQDLVYFDSFRKKASKNVVFLGFTAEEDVPLLFNAADLVVLPYRQITQSGVLNISLSYDIPTITSDLEYFREIYDEYRCISLFQAGDPHSLSLSIQKLLEDRGLYNQLKENIQKYIQNNTYSSVALKLNEIYRISGV